MDLVVPAICDDQSLDISFLPVDLEDIATADEENQQTNGPVNTSPPVISGKNDVGELFTGNDGTWTGTLPITFTYQWKRNGTNIIGETNSTYTTVLADSGQTITCEVTATNIVGSTSVISNSALIT